MGSAGIRDLTLCKTLRIFEIISYFLPHVMLSVLTDKHRTKHFVRGSIKTQAARTGDTHRETDYIQSGNHKLQPEK